MSAIDTSHIDTTYPVAGRDNDSQGFRTNFSEIAVGLQLAHDEITELQAKAVLKSKLDQDMALDNDLGGNLIADGVYNQLNPVFTNRGSDTQIKVFEGPVQKYVLQNNTTFTWTGWHTSTDEYQQLRLIFTLDASLSGTRNVSFVGNMKPATGFPSPLTVSTTKIKVVEAWTIDGGETVQLTYIGEY